VIRHAPCHPVLDGRDLPDKQSDDRDGQLDHGSEPHASVAIAGDKN
jgi:hypothetical protein